MNKKEVFVVGCYPDTDEKIEILEKTIDKIIAVNLPIIIVTHYSIPQKIFNKVDFIIYDRKNIISDWHLNYWVLYPNFVKIVGKTEGMGYHAVACLSSIRNAVEFCRDKYDIMHFIESDIDFKIEEYLSLARSNLEHKLFYAYEYDIKTNLGLPYDNLEGIWTGLMSFDINWYYDKMPDIRTWEDYTYVAEHTGERVDYILEYWFYHVFKSKGMLKDSTIQDYTKFFDVVINKNLTDTGKTDSKIKILISELDNSEDIILFFINGTDQPVNYNLKFSDTELDQTCYSGQIHYRLFSKSIGRIEASTEKIKKVFNIEKNKTYIETRFRFYDDRVKCLMWGVEDNCNFISNEENKS